MENRALQTEKQIPILRYLCIATLAATQFLFATDLSANKNSDRGKGIWKAAVPPNGMKGEFNNHDPIGLATGAKIKVDCSLNWINPDTGKLYCFNSATSLVYFLDWPNKNIEKAAEAWRNLQSKEAPTHASERDAAKPK